MMRHKTTTTTTTRETEDTFGAGRSPDATSPRSRSGRGGHGWLAFAFGGLAFAGCSSTSATNGDAGPDTTQDDSSVSPGDDAPSGDDTTTSSDDGATPGDDSSETTDAATGSVADGAPTDGAGGTATQDGALAGCVRALFGTYAQRADGALFLEGTTEETILDATTALPLTGIVSVGDGDVPRVPPRARTARLACWQTNAGRRQREASQPRQRIDDGKRRSVSRDPGTDRGEHSAHERSLHGDGGLERRLRDHERRKDVVLGRPDRATVNKGTTLHSGYGLVISTDGMAALTGVTQASLGVDQGCALVQGSPNTVWCWGSDTSDELGQGDTTARQYPTKVLGLSNPTKVMVVPANPGVSLRDGVRARRRRGSLLGPVTTTAARESTARRTRSRVRRPS